MLTKADRRKRHGLNVEPHEYQFDCSDWIVDRLFADDRKGAAVFADPGLGKTLITLMTIERLKRYGETKQVLIVAPNDVVDLVWPKEIAGLGFDFTFAKIKGTIPQKHRAAQNRSVDLHITNVESIPWIAKEGYAFWDLLVIDESTAFKNWTAVRMKALRKLLPYFRKRLILTGTPIPNSFADLFSQIFIVDDGVRLGKTVTFFRDNFCYQDRWQKFHFEDSEKNTGTVNREIEDCVYRIDEKDHLDLPEMVYNPIWIQLPPALQRRYNKLERDLFIELEKREATDKEGILLGEAAAKYAACRGFANGGVYENETQYVYDSGGVETKKRVRIDQHHIHDEKTKRLASLRDEYYRKPMLVAYSFDHDLDRLTKQFVNKRTRTAILRGGKNRTPDDLKEQYVDDWNAGLLDMFIIQPQRASHGLNLQFGGNHVVWYGLTDMPEVFSQFNKRLHRQGVRGTVWIHMILAKDTVDEMAWERQQAKGDRQRDFLTALNEYRKRKASQ